MYSLHRQSGLEIVSSMPTRFSNEGEKKSGTVHVHQVTLRRTKKNEVLTSHDNDKTENQVGDFPFRDELENSEMALDDFGWAELEDKAISKLKSVVGNQDSRQLSLGSFFTRFASEIW